MLKKITIAAIIMAMTFTFGANVSFAQDTVSHLEFQGIPLNGELDSFVKKLQEQGFTEIKRGINVVAMTGQVAGKEADIFIVGTMKTQTVWKVEVDFATMHSFWNNLKSEYEQCVEMYMEQYGAPMPTFSFIEEGEGNEMQAVREGKCYYYSGFHMQEGNVSVEISEAQRVRVTYEDAANTLKRYKEAEESEIDNR